MWVAWVTPCTASKLHAGNTTQARKRAAGLAEPPAKPQLIRRAVYARKGTNKPKKVGEAWNDHDQARIVARWLDQGF